MLGVRLDPELEERLERLARGTGRSKSYYAREAIREYVEDREDYELAVAASREAGPGPYMSLEEVIRELGLENKRRKTSAKTTRKTQRGSATANHGIPAATGRRRA
jgi:RHH-type rel operon transcriptional repressor/antitoxin RelB